MFCLHLRGHLNILGHNLELLKHTEQNLNPFLLWSFPYCCEVIFYFPLKTTSSSELTSSQKDSSSKGISVRKQYKRSRDLVMSSSWDKKLRNIFYSEAQRPWDISRVYTRGMSIHLHTSLFDSIFSETLIKIRRIHDHRVRIRNILRFGKRRNAKPGRSVWEAAGFKRNISSVVPTYLDVATALQHRRRSAPVSLQR